MKTELSFTTTGGCPEARGFMGKRGGGKIPLSLWLWAVMLLVLPAAAESGVNVAVSIVPQKYFVEKIGGEHVEVIVMIPPGASPERYEPKPRQMIALSRAKIYFACGVQFESGWLQKIAASSPDLLVVHTDEGIEKKPMEAHGHGHQEEGEAPARSETDPMGGHGQGGLDPHIWLSPPLVMLQTRHMLDALLQVDPGHKDAYEANYKAFLKELVALDLAIKNVFSGRGANRSFMVFHPAWGYFADAYGLKQIPVEIEGKEPKAQDLRQLVLTAREQKIKVIFVQPQFSTRSAQTIADAMGGRIMFADPLAEDWAANLQSVAHAIVSASTEH